MVGLKLSCTEFATEKTLGSLYHFDRNGAILPYSTFVSLMKDSKFLNEFMAYAKNKYEELEGPLVTGGGQDLDVNSLGRVDEDEEDSDQEIVGPLSKRVKKAGKKDKKSN